MGRATALGCCVSLVAFSGLLSADLVAADTIDFNRDIRPLLSDRCFACHGPDEEDRQAGLRLDETAAATAELDSGLRAIVPGQAAASEMLARITSADPDVVMPPPEVGKPITPAELNCWLAGLRMGPSTVTTGLSSGSSGRSARVR
jgi:Planctomycete cytochrome C.